MNEQLAQLIIDWVKKLRKLYRISGRKEWRKEYKLFHEHLKNNNIKLNFNTTWLMQSYCYEVDITMNNNKYLLFLNK